jgi:hypothetical protein
MRRWEERAEESERLKVRREGVKMTKKSDFPKKKLGADLRSLRMHLKMLRAERREVKNKGIGSR